MKNNRLFLILLFALVWVNSAIAQDWTHYVRTSGHGCEMDQLHAIMNDAGKPTCLASKWIMISPAGTAAYWFPTKS